MPPKPEQSGVTANQQISQNDFHDGVGDLGRNVQRICQITQATARFVITDPEQTEAVEYKVGSEPRYQSDLQPNPFGKETDQRYCKFKRANNPKQVLQFVKYAPFHRR